MYKKVKIIDSKKDLNLKIGEIKDFKYSKNLMNIIITAEEFFRASKSQPIVFSKKEDGEFVATAIMGIKENSNLFVNAKGEWKNSEYIPAYLRRYPFIFVQNEETLALAVDEDCKAVNEKEGQSLFDENGESSEYTKKVMEFMQNFQSSSIKTANLIKELDSLGLLEETNVNMTIKDEKLSFTGFMRVNEAKLNELSDEDTLKLVKSGAYKLITAHLISLTNFDKLVSYYSSK